MCDLFGRHNWYSEIFRIHQLTKLVFGYLFSKTQPSSAQGSVFLYQWLKSTHVPIYDSNMLSIEVSINPDVYSYLLEKTDNLIITLPLSL